MTCNTRTVVQKKKNKVDIGCWTSLDPHRALDSIWLSSYVSVLRVLNVRGPRVPVALFLSHTHTHTLASFFFFFFSFPSIQFELIRSQIRTFKSKSRSICLSPFLFLPSFESSQWRPQQVRRRRHSFLLRRRHRRWRAEWRKGATIICISNIRVRILRLHSRRPGERGFVRPRRGSARCPLAPPARGAPFTEESPGFLLYFIITPLLLLLKKEFNLFCLFFFFFNVSISYEGLRCPFLVIE